MISPAFTGENRAMSVGTTQMYIDIKPEGCLMITIPGKLLAGCCFMSTYPFAIDFTGIPASVRISRPSW